MWLATNDLLSAALVKPMQDGYIDVATTWDAYLQAKEAVRVIIAIAEKQDPKCGPDGCLAKGRVVNSGDHQRHAEFLVARLQIELGRRAKEAGAFDTPPPTAILPTIQDTIGSFKHRRPTVIVLRKSAFVEPRYRRRFSPAPAATTAAGARIRPAVKCWPWFGKDALGRAWRGR